VLEQPKPAYSVQAAQGQCLSGPADDLPARGDGGASLLPIAISGLGSLAFGFGGVNGYAAATQPSPSATASSALARATWLAGAVALRRRQIRNWRLSGVSSRSGNVRCRDMLNLRDYLLSPV